MIRYEDYETSSRRAVLGTAAVALTAITLALSLLVPAKMTSAGREVPASALSKSAPPATADVVSGPLHIDVIGVREPSFASAQVRNVHAKRKQQG